MDTGMNLFFDHRDRDQVGRLGTVRLDIQTRTRCLMRKVTGSSRKPNESLTYLEKWLSVTRVLTHGTSDVPHIGSGFVSVERPHT